ncbi:hypothetical protein QBC41DRAFT_54520 [Cercophora samala]|uniref:Uncharacterized protein n=1 Tax=Cercophora samala TaxID=330535 RepID=A0AA40DCJ9_9PEZI|nr:hypothetical protein QBC41DRAFT_54520 [Cercophora samala]
MAPPKLSGQVLYQNCRRLFDQQSLSTRTFTTSCPSFSNGAKQTSRFAKKTETHVRPSAVDKPQPKPNVVVEPPAAMEPKKPVDTNSKEYKRVARKVTSLMVALPFLIVTSYYLWDRLSLGRPIPPPSDDTPVSSPEPEKA